MTVINLSSFLVQLDALVSASDDELKQVRREHHIKAAVQRYSEDKPLIQSDDLTGDGGKFYVLTSANLAAWDEGLSRIISIEYPAATIASDETPQYLEQKDWDADYWADISGTLTRHLYLPNHSPASTETMRITYTAPYEWSAGNVTKSVNQVSHGFSVNDYVYLGTDDDWLSVSNTLTNLATHQVTVVTDTANFTITDLSVDMPSGDFFAVCYLAAGLTCQSLSAKYSRTSSSSLALDSVNHTTRAGEFSTRATEFISLYNEHLNLTDGDGEAGPEAAGAFVDWDTSPSRTRRWIFH